MKQISLIFVLFAVVVALGCQPEETGSSGVAGTPYATVLLQRNSDTFTVGMEQYLVSDELLIPIAEELMSAFDLTSAEDMAFTLKSWLTVEPITDPNQLNWVGAPELAADQGVYEVRFNAPSGPLGMAILKKWVGQIEKLPLVVKKKDEPKETTIDTGPTPDELLGQLRREYPHIIRWNAEETQMVPPANDIATQEQIWKSLVETVTKADLEERLDYEIVRKAISKYKASMNSDNIVYYGALDELRMAVQSSVVSWEVVDQSLESEINRKQYEELQKQLQEKVDELGEDHDEVVAMKRRMKVYEELTGVNQNDETETQQKSNQQEFLAIATYLNMQAQEFDANREQWAQDYEKAEKLYRTYEYEVKSLDREKNEQANKQPETETTEKPNFEFSYKILKLRDTCKVSPDEIDEYNSLRQKCEKLPTLDFSTSSSE